MSTQINLDDAMLQAVSIISDKKISKAQLASTIQGTIIECKDEARNKYLVQYQDSKIEAYGLNGTKYSKDTRVYIYIPDGKVSSQYKVILGSPNQLATDAIEKYENQEFYDTGQNFITTKDLKIGMVSQYSEQVFLYKNEEGFHNLINLSSNITGIIKNTNHLKLSGIVQTDLTNEQKRFGRYGIRISLKMKNSATGNQEAKDFYFDSNNFEGNPYQFNTASSQEVYWPIDNINFVGINSISYFVEDFPKQVSPVPDIDDENRLPADIIITDFAINGSYQFNDVEKTTVGIVLKMPNGSTFGEVAEGVDRKTANEEVRLIEAELRVSMKTIDPSDPNLSIYWFKQDASISSSSFDFSHIGGLGWKCLNEHIKQSNIINEGTEQEETIIEEIRDFIPSNSIKIRRKEVEYSQQTLFKCVAVYDGKKYPAKEFTIINKDAKYRIEITSSEGTHFTYSAGKPTLTCRVFSGTKDGTQQEVTDNPGFAYYWKVCNNQNVTTELKEDENHSLKYTKALELIDFLQQERERTNQWEDLMDPNEEGVSEDILAKRKECYKLTLTQEEDLKTYAWFFNQFKEVLNWFKNEKQQVQGNILYNVDLHQITRQSTFWCSCYQLNSKGEKEYLVGSASITLENTKTPTDGYLLVINHGEQVFLYDEQGASLQNAAIDEPYEIFPLSYTLYYNGKAIEQEDLRNNVFATWKVPNTRTMLKAKASSENSVGQYNLYHNLDELPFEVADIYNSSFSNNDIFLELEYNEQLFITKTNFTFTKQGQNGTNGTKYYFKLQLVDDPTNGIQDGIIKIKESEKEKQFAIKPKFWYNGIGEEVKPSKVYWKTLANNLKKRYTEDTEDSQEIKKSCLNLDMSTDDFTVEDNVKTGTVKPTGIGGDFITVNLNDDWLEHIVQAECSQNGFKYYADLPIPIIKIYQNEYNDYDISLTPDSGFRNVVYRSDGTQPKYDNRLPFEIIVTKRNVLDKEEDVSNYESEHLVYTWEVFPREDPLLKLEKVGKNNQRKAVPNRIFTRGNQVNNAIFVQIQKEIPKTEEELQNLQQGQSEFNYIPLADIHIPVYFMLNKYENRALNDWNGTSIEINETEGYILTPQVGAGKKKDNAFTGIVMGAAATGSVEQIGLFGYSGGVRSIFLDADTGNATFGKAGSDGGQIMIDVTSKDGAIIRSGDYYDENGLNYYNVTTDEEKREYQQKAKGMEIQFSGDPHIRFASGNFSVNSNGQITAQGGGTIAGWVIRNNFLSKDGVRISSDNSDVKNKAFQVTYDNIDKFYVTHEGYLFSRFGQIGGWNIDEDMLSIAKNNCWVGMAPSSTINIPNSYVKLINPSSDASKITNMCFWAGPFDWSGSERRAKPNFFVTQDGFLFSSSGNIAGWNLKEDRIDKTFNDGTKTYWVGISPSRTFMTKKDIAPPDGELNNVCFWAGTSSDVEQNRLNPNFFVKRDGYLYSKLGKIGNWNIGDGGLYQGTSTFKDENGNIVQKDKDVYIGSDGIRLGDTFYVTDGGYIYALKGNVGGCTVNSGGISGGSGWKIEPGGHAQFTDVKIGGTSMINLIGLRSSGGSGGSTSIGNGAARTSGNGLNLSSKDVTVTYQGSTMTLQEFVDTLANDVVTKRLKADRVQVSGTLVANSVRVYDDVYNGMAHNAPQVFDWLSDLSGRVSNLEKARPSTSP